MSFEFNLSAFPRLLKSENLWHSSNFWPFFFSKIFFLTQPLSPLLWDSSSTYDRPFKVVSQVLTTFFPELLCCSNLMISCFGFFFFPQDLWLFSSLSVLLFSPLSNIFFFLVFSSFGKLLVLFHSFCLFCKNCMFPVISSVFIFTSWSLVTFSSLMIPASGLS